MGGAGEKMIQLQSRDREILSLCYEHQFLLMEHVSVFFKEKGERRAYERVQELEGAGLLRREPSLIFGSSRVIRLTKLGVDTVRGTYAVPIPQIKRLNLTTLQHDAIVTSVRLRLKEVWDGAWVPERLLKKAEFPEVPDGLVVFPSGRRLAIEVENSLKGKARFLGLLNRWSASQAFLILYIATTPRLFETLKGYIGEGPKSPKSPVFGLVQWDDLRDGVPHSFSAHGALDLFTRRVF